MPPPIPFTEFTRRFEVAARRWRGACLYHLPNGAPLCWLYGKGAGAASTILALLGGLHGDEVSGPLMLLEWLETAPEPLPPPWLPRLACSPLSWGCCSGFSMQIVERKMGWEPIDFVLNILYNQSR